MRRLLKAVRTRFYRGGFENVGHPRNRTTAVWHPFADLGNPPFFEAPLLCDEGQICKSRSSPRSAMGMGSSLHRASWRCTWAQQNGFGQGQCRRAVAVGLMSRHVARDRV